MEKINTPRLDLVDGLSSKSFAEPVASIHSLKTEQCNIVKDNATDTVLGSIAESQQQNLTQALDDYGKSLKESITRQDGSLSQQTLAHKQGFVAEAHHAGSYNIEAAAKGETRFRAWTDRSADTPLPRNDQVTDIRITSASGNDVDYQLKFYKNGEASAKAITDMDYTKADVGKVVPGEQLTSARETARHEALRNKHNRPELSRDYEHTAGKVTDNISHPERSDIKSQRLNRKGKNSSEDLTKQIEKGKKPKYSRSEGAQSDLQRLQYANAAKYGALAGFLTSTAGQFYDVLRSDRPLTQEECQRIAGEIIKGTACGAGKAVLTIGVQHAGKELAKRGSSEVAKTIGKHLSKGNIAANIAMLTASLAKDLYRLSCGEIDGVELTESTLKTSINLAASAGGYAIGTSAAGMIAPYMTSLLGTSTANFAVMGASLGALGPMALGAVGGMAASMVVASYCDHFSQKGIRLAISDINTSMTLLQSGQLDMGGYIDRVGSMSELTFSWGDLIPFSGTFSVLGEYGTRKRQLVAIQQQIQTLRAGLPAREAAILDAMQHQYQQQMWAIEEQFQEKKAELFEQANEVFSGFESELDHHLEMHYHLHLCKNARRLELMHQQDRKTQKIQGMDERIQVYTREMNRLQNDIASLDKLPNDVRRYMRIAIDNRINEVLPKVTPADLATRYFSGEFGRAV